MRWDGVADGALRPTSTRAALALALLFSALGVAHLVTYTAGPTAWWFVSGALGVALGLRDEVDAQLVGRPGRQTRLLVLEVSGGLLASVCYPGAELAGYSFLAGVLTTAALLLGALAAEAYRRGVIPVPGHRVGAVVFALFFAPLFLEAGWLEMVGALLLMWGCGEVAVRSLPPGNDERRVVTLKRTLARWGR